MQNDFRFDFPTNFTTYFEVNSFIANTSLYKLILMPSGTIMITYPIASDLNDNVVGFLSQIGMTTSNKKIEFNKIYVDIDTDGGNYLWDHFHGKIAHRTVIMEKVLSYLSE